MAKQKESMFYIFAVLLFSTVAKGQQVQPLNIPLLLNKPVTAITCKYVPNEKDQQNLQIPFSTMYRFWPEKGDSTLSYNFNLDITGKVCSIVIISPVDSFFYNKINEELGPPTRKVEFGFSASEKENYTLWWAKESELLEWCQFESRQYVIILNKDGTKKDFMKFRF